MAHGYGETTQQLLKWAIASGKQTTNLKGFKGGNMQSSKSHKSHKRKQQKLERGCNMDKFFPGEPVVVISPDFDKGTRGKKIKIIRRNGIVYNTFPHHVTVDFGNYKESFTKKDLAFGIAQIIPVMPVKTIPNGKEELLYVSI